MNSVTQSLGVGDKAFSSEFDILLCTKLSNTAAVTCVRLSSTKTFGQPPHPTTNNFDYSHDILCSHMGVGVYLMLLCLGAQINSTSHQTIQFIYTTYTLLKQF